MEITFTRALLSNLNKRLQDLGSDERSRTTKAKAKPPLAENKWISEVNVALSNFDLVIHVEKLDTLIEIAIELANLVNQSKKASDERKQPNAGTSPTRKTLYLIPLIKPKQMPLLNIDILNVRLIIPLFERNRHRQADETVVAQMRSLNLTSQVENPLLRNFLNNSASLALYNKAKSAGTLYKPGFELEDRQYALDVKDMALFRTRFTHLTSGEGDEGTLKPNKLSTPILDNFDLKAVLGLPILLKKRLINGYTLELSIPTTSLSLYFGNIEVNLLYSILKQNLEALEAYMKRLIEPTARADSKRVLNEHDEPVEADLKILPMDVLLTAENINVYFYTLEASASNFKKADPFIHLQLIQPHTCLVMHQHFQKFEISVFDISLRRASFLAASSVNCSFEENEYALPQSSDFLIPLIETKPGEPNSKTGVLNGVVSLKLNNFASLFCYDSSSTSSSSSYGTAENQKETYVSEHLICVCNECQRCFEFKSNSLKNSSSSYPNEGKFTKKYIAISYIQCLAHQKL